MRFVWAVAAFVLAAVMIGAGIAQRTVFQGPRTQAVELSVSEEAPYLLIDGAVFDAAAGTPTLRAEGDGTVFAAVGRTADMEAWLADASYNEVTLDDEGAMTAELVEPAVTEDDTEAAGDAAADEAAAPTAPPATDEAAATPGRDPVGSDLWLDEYQEDDVLITPLGLNDGQSVLVASDGTTPAPAQISVSWPIRNGTPWAGPLIMGGGIVMAVGVLLYILGIRHARRSRGPRRKGLPLPATEPIDLAVEGADKGVISAGTPRRRLEGGSKRAFIAIPAVAVSALLFTGCQADAWPQFGSTPTPTPTATVIVPEGQQEPAVTKAQAERILDRIAATVAEADENRDATLAATRLDGAALAARSTNYTLRGTIADYAAMPTLHARPVSIVLPQAFDEWPRSFVAVVDDSESKTSNIMVVTQDDPWTDYKLSYLGNLEASTELPDLAPSYIGASQVQPDSPFLLMPPDQLAAAYADILTNGENSSFYDLFEAEGDAFREGVVSNRQTRLDEFNQTGSQTASLTFASQPGEHDPFAIATLESGAIVAVNVDEVDTVKPNTTDAVIKLDNNPTVQALTGATQSATGITTTFSDQLFFYVPGPNSNEKIRLLGYSSDLLSAQVIP